MRVTKNKTKNGLSFYIIRSVDGGSTEVVEKLGTEKEIMDKYHCKDAEAWARERARKLTENEKESREKVLVPFRPHVLLDMDQKQSFQIGYLFLQQIYYELKLPLICNAIAKRHAWYLPGSDRKYKLSELDEEKDCDRVFYKDRWINENDLEQHLIVTYSIKYRNYQRAVRGRQIVRAEKLAENPSSLSRKKENDPKRFVMQEHCTTDGEAAEKTITSLDQNRIDNEMKYDGFYAVCTNLEDDVSDIIRINQKRWEIEECFRIMKTEFKARPVYLSRRDRITAHFTTCFTALVIYRMLEKKLENRFTCEEIIGTLRDMSMMIAPGEGYIPTYTRTDLTDALHEAFGFRTDYQITSQKSMRKILNQTRK